MWTSQSMTLFESFITFLIGFSVVFMCLISLALFVLISSKIIGMINSTIPQEKTQAAAPKVTKPTPAPVVKDNQEELENLAVIISAISEELREPVENFQIVSIKEI